MSSLTNSRDPWLVSTVSSFHDVKLEFEDTFVQRPTFEPLEDSYTYLATLEKKLLILKNGKGNQQKKELVKAAEKTWYSYMYRIIASESRESLNVNQDPELNATVTPNLIYSWINPEQALTVGELAELLKNDSVALNAQDKF